MNGWFRLGSAASANTDTDGTNEVIDRIVEQTYRPIVRGYFGLAALYYMIITLVHFMTLDSSGLRIMATVAITAALSSAASWWALRRTLSIGRLELVVSWVNLMVLTNVMATQQVNYAQGNFVYFIMMVMVFAFTSVSLRQAFGSILVVLACLYLELKAKAPDEIVTYGFIAFAASLTALAISQHLRLAIGRTARARNEAEHLGEKMRQRSLADSLTALPNRRAFFDTLKQHKEKASDGHRPWLIVLDLDGFKSVNDIYGHILGDELLKAVSGRLRSLCGEMAQVSRMGGDEFNIILFNQESPKEVKTWCQQALEHIAQVYQIGDRLIQISASMGCNRITGDMHDTEITRNADYALLYAKKHGKNRVVIFEGDHAKNAAKRYEIEQALRVANFDDELSLLFQPQFDLSENRIIRAEALARWDSPTLGKVGPNHFIEIAEETGLIAKITIAVVGKAVEQLQNSENPVPLSINLSSYDLISNQIIKKITRIVSDSGVDPALIEFEVTETAMMVDVEKATANLHKLANIGHPISLDDFGTGYSNFNYLRTLPIEKLKVDRSFMENIADPMTEKILHSLSGMAKTLGVHCLLEGVENELELLVAKRVGAQSVQGFYFGEPMSAAELQNYIAHENDCIIQGNHQISPRQNTSIG